MNNENAMKEFESIATFGGFIPIENEKFQEDFNKRLSNTVNYINKNINKKEEP